MAIQIWAAAWLLIQIAAQDPAVKAGPESCTENISPEHVTNQAALLQKGVGKHRVTLVDINDFNYSELENQTVQAPENASIAQATVPAITGSRVEGNHKNASIAQATAPAVGDNLRRMPPQPSSSQQAAPEGLAAAQHAAPEDGAAMQAIAQSNFTNDTFDGQGRLALTVPLALGGRQAAPEPAVQHAMEPAPQAVAQLVSQADAQPIFASVVATQGLAQPSATFDGQAGLVQAERGSSKSSSQLEVEAASLLNQALSSALSATQLISHYLHKEFPAAVVRTFPSLKTDMGVVFGMSLLTCSIWSILVAAAASLYRSQKSYIQAVSSRPEQDFNEWTSGPFDIFSDLNVCCWSCLCPCIRWADNMDMLGIISFWIALLLFCGLIMLNTVPGGLLLWLVASLLWMSFRQQLRVKFDMEQNTFRTFAGDCLLYLCCWPCAISQEARHIEEACRAAHKAVQKFEAV